MKYSPEFLAQKAIMLRDHRCPHFTKVQLKMLFKMLDESLRGGPESLVALGGGPENPTFEGYVTGSRQTIETEKAKEYVRPFQYGTYHTHPAPWDWPIPPKSLEELKKFKREKKVVMHGPSFGDMMKAFENSHQVLCIGGRQEEALGGEAMIMCWTPPPLDLISKWDMTIWNRISMRRITGKALQGCRDEVGDIEDHLNEEIYQGMRLVERQKEETDPSKRKELTERLIQLDDVIKGLRREKEEKLKNCDGIRDLVIDQENRIKRDLQDYWLANDPGPCIYVYPEYPTMVSSEEEKEKRKEYKDYYGQNVIPIGQCFDYAFKRALKAIVNDEDVTIVHAKVQFWTDKPYEHAWVETDDLVQDWQTMVSGSSKFAGVGWKKDVFYDTFHPTNIRRYTPKEVVSNTEKYGHSGPWS